MNLTDEQAKRIIELAGLIDVDLDDITPRDLSRALVIIERKLNFFQTPININEDNNINILIADDLELSIYQLNQMLKKIGIIPSVARNKEEAFAEIEKKNFKYITIDLFLPAVEDGFSLIEKCIKVRDEKNTDTKIIVISSTDDKNLIDKCFKMGIDQFISKSNSWHEQILKYISDTVGKHETNKSFTKYTINNNIEMYTLLKCNNEKHVDEIVKSIATTVYGGCTNIILNLEKIKLFDAENANLFTEAFRICAESYGKLVLLNAPEEIIKILDDSFLTDIIPTVNSTEEALLILTPAE